MPFTDDAGHVARLLDLFGKGQFGKLQAFAMFGVIIDRMNDRFDAGTLLVATRQEACAGRRTHGSRGVKVGQADAFASQPIDLGRLEIGIAKTTDSFITHVVDHHDDQVGSRRRGGRGRRAASQGDTEQQE